MEIYCLRNSEGYYLSMDGSLTTEWLQASKFREDSIERRMKSVDESFKLVKFEVSEVEVLCKTMSSK